MISEIYNNRILYYNAMKNFLYREIGPWEFKKLYWSQRHDDLSKDRINGYFDNYENKTTSLIGNEKIFEREYADALYEKGSVRLAEYEEGAKNLDIKGEMFFMGLWYFIDEYVREYYPRDDEGFDPQFNVDEQTLTTIIQAVFDILKRNKERWEYSQDEGVKI